MSELNCLISLGLTDMKASDDVNQRCGTPTFGVGLTSNALPKEKQSYLGNCSQVGVSSLYVPIEYHQLFIPRATYDRVEKDIETLKKNVAYVYIPKHYIIQSKNGKKKRVLDPLSPNLVFVYSTQNHFEQLYREENDLRHLRFYRNKTKNIFQLDEKYSLVVVPYYEIRNFIKLKNVESKYIKLFNLYIVITRMVTGYLTDSGFAGVFERVARIAG